MTIEFYEEELIDLRLNSSGELVLDMQSEPDISMNHFALENIGVNTHDQIDSHIASTSNPHSVTKAQVGLGNVVNLDTSTTANIADSVDKRFVTDADLVDIGNLSGVNTGDQDLSGKSDVGHTHPLSDIQQSGATSGQVPSWDGSAWVPVDQSGGTGNIDGGTPDSVYGGILTIIDGGVP